MKALGWWVLDKAFAVYATARWGRGLRKGRRV